MLQALKQQLLHHGLRPLNDTSAQQSFCQWSDMTADKLTLQLQQLQASIIEACKGLPLALCVAGGQLESETDLGRWQVRSALFELLAQAPKCDLGFKYR